MGRVEGVDTALAQGGGVGGGPGPVSCPQRALGGEAQGLVPAEVPGVGRLPAAITGLGGVAPPLPAYARTPVQAFRPCTGAAPATAGRIARQPSAGGC